MKKLIILLTLVAVSFSVDKWEYTYAVYQMTLEWEGESVDSEVYYTFTWNAIGIDIYNTTSILTTFREGHSTQVYLDEMNQMGADGWEFVFKENIDTDSGEKYEDFR